MQLFAAPVILGSKLWHHVIDFLGEVEDVSHHVVVAVENCLVNAGPRSPRSGRRSTVKAILARGVVLEPHEGASGLVGGNACYQNNGNELLVYLDEWS